MIEIRPLAPEEVEHVIRSGLGLARLDQGEGMYLVAWDGDMPIGHARLALTDPPELQDVEVLPAHRRRGAATSLTQAAEHHARERGHCRLRVTVSVDNDAAQALYRRLGYEDAGVPPRRVVGTIVIRTGPLAVDDTLLTWEKAVGALGGERPGASEGAS
jgi:GNAT superfamily N-acetyltransferase